MISSNTRASRSRFSSPAQPLEVSKSSANEGSRIFMQRWLEPSVQSKASFEEAGLMRYGVLETMAPLGTLPKSKKAEKSGGNENGSSGHSVRKIILRPSGSQHAAAAAAAAAASAAVATEEEETVPPKPRRRASSPALPSSPPAPTSAPPARRIVIAREADDSEYDPRGGGGGGGGGPRRRQSRRVSLPSKPRHQQQQEKQQQEKQEPPQQQPATEPKHTVIRAKPATPKRVRQREPEDRDFADKVVEAAVEEALKHYRYPTAWALRTLYDEKSGDADFVAMVEEVFKQTADAETMEEFSKLIEEKKREGKKDNQGCYYFVPPSTNNRFTPRKPRAAPYGKLIILPRRFQEEKGETRAAKKAKVSHSAETPRIKKMSNGSKSHGSLRTPSRRRARRDSGSSESSLSSAMSLSSPEGSEDELSPSTQKRTIAIATTAATGGGATATATSTMGGRSQSHDAPKSQPITTTRRKSLASNRQAVSNNTSEPNSPTYSSRTHTSNKADASMPGKVASSDLLSSTPSVNKSSNNNNGKSSHHNNNSKDVGSVINAHMPVDDEDDDPFWNRRRDAQKITNGYRVQESSMRDGEEEQEAATPARRTRRTRHSLVAPISTRSTRSTSKRPPNEDGDIIVSPLAFSFHEGSSTVGSRAATPTTLRPTKKPRTGLRIKSSPVKKKGGTAAGVPRPMSDAQSVSANTGTPREQGSENDEYCSACGNAGDVVCCDGCPRSFHFECVDMVQSESLPDEWYCNECFVRRYPSRVPIYKGAFASALSQLEKSIPRAFSLPKQLQNRFEGVKAGADGDYEEITANKIARKRPGYDELPDFFKQREDGEAVLCHACQTPATEIRAIIPCSVCPFHWHIDCLDPPLAMPPVLKTWRCPAHVDDILTDAPPLAPAHRYRRLKGGQLITPVFSRGVKNNGYIEIDWADEPEERHSSGWKDPESFGRSYRLPARGVILDFIEQLRHQGAGYGSRQNESRWLSNPLIPTHDSHLPIRGSTSDRRVEEMQASLNLVALKQKRSDNIDQLTSALLAAADNNVLALIAKGNADNFELSQLVRDDEVSLRTMLAQMNAMSDRIRQLLGEEAPPISTTPTLKTMRSGTPGTEPSGEDECVDKAESTAPIAEPTPPSTVDHGEGTMELD